MKGLFEQRGDEYTYSSDELYFIMTEQEMLTQEFHDKLREMFPTIEEYQILELVINEEQITVYDDCGYKCKIFVGDVKTLQSF